MTKEGTSEKEIRLLLRMRDDLQKRKKNLEDELSDLASVLKGIDAIVVRDGFRRASASPVVSEEADRSEGLVTVKSRDGTLLATAVAGGNVLELSFSEDQGLSADLPPFESFLVDRVLAGMRSSDEEKVSRGELGAESVLAFDIDMDEGKLMRLTIRNV